MLHELCTKCKDVVVSKENLSKKVFVTSSLVLTSATNCFADAPAVFAESSDGLTSALDTLTTSVTSGLSTVGGKAILVFGVFVVWRLGMKLYGVVTAKG